MAQPPTQEPRVREILRGGAAAGSAESSGVDALSRFSDRLTSRYESVGLATSAAMQPQRGGLLDRLLQPLPAEQFVGALRMLSPGGYGAGVFQEAYDHIRLFAEAEPALWPDSSTEASLSDHDAVDELSTQRGLAPELLASLGPTGTRVGLEDVTLSPRHLPAISAALRGVASSPDPETMAASYRAQNSAARSWLESSAQALPGRVLGQAGSEQARRSPASGSGAKGSSSGVRLTMASLVGRSAIGLDSEAAPPTGSIVGSQPPTGLQGAAREARPGRAPALEMDVVGHADGPRPSRLPGQGSFEFQELAEAEGSLSTGLPGPPLERALATRRALAEIASRSGLRRLEASQRSSVQDSGPGGLRATGGGDASAVAPETQTMGGGAASQTAPLLAQVRALLRAGVAVGPESLSQGWTLLDRAARLVGGRVSGSGVSTDGGSSPTLMRLPVAGTETSPWQADALLEIERLANAMSRSEVATRHAGPGDTVGLPGVVVAAGAAEAGADGVGEVGETRQGVQAASESAAPSYFKVSNLGQDLVRRLRRSKSGRRLSELLSEGAIGQAFALPQVSAGAAASAARAPRGAVPVAGGAGAAGTVAKLDMEILAAMDMWETAFPGRMPYDSGDDLGGGDEEPDFQHTAPTFSAASAASGAGPGAPGPEVARIMKDLGLAQAGRGSMTPAGGSARLPAQGGTADLSMSLIRPVMQIVEQRSQPLLKEAVEGSPGTSGTPGDKGISKADPEKVDYVAHQIVERLQRLIEVEQNRRGF